MPHLPSPPLFQQDGFVFRIRVAYQREPQILKEAERDDLTEDTPALPPPREGSTRQLPLLTKRLAWVGPPAQALIACSSSPILLTWPSVWRVRPVKDMECWAGVRQVLEVLGFWPCRLTGFGP